MHLFVFVHETDQFFSNAKFSTRMSSIWNHHQIGMRSSLMQFPSGDSGTDHIIASLHNIHGNVLQFVHILEDEIVLEKDVVDKVVTFNARKGGSEIQVVGFSH